MTFSVPITGVSPDPEVYGGLTAAASYIGSQFAPQATAWLTASPDDKGRTLRTATLYLDRIAWEGTATGLVGVDPTTLQWPRSGVLVNSAEVDPTTVPADIVAAAFELAVAIFADPTLVTKADQGSNIASVSSGGDSVTFAFPKTIAAGTTTRFPLVVQQLIGKYLAVPSGVIEGGTGAYGKCVSSFSSCRQYTLRGPE